MREETVHVRPEQAAKIQALSAKVGRAQEQLSEALDMALVGLLPEGGGRVLAVALDGRVVVEVPDAAGD